MDATLGSTAGEGTEQTLKTEWAGDTYGAGGTRTSVTEFQYNLQGRLSEVTVDDTVTSAINYEYAPVTGSLARTYIDNATTDVEYFYDNLGRLEHVHVRSLFDSTSIGSRWTHYAYDLVGNLQSSVTNHGEGLGVSYMYNIYAYDELNRLIQLRQYVESFGNPTGITEDVATFDYNLDAYGKRIRAVETGRNGEVDPKNWTA